MVTVWKRAAHSVNHMFPSYYVYLLFKGFHFGFEGRTLVLITPVSSHCLPFTVKSNIILRNVSTLYDIYAKCLV